MENAGINAIPAFSIVLARDVIGTKHTRRNNFVWGTGKNGRKEAEED